MSTSSPHCPAGHTTTTHDEVACAAFRLYEKHGSQDGHDIRNWLDAEVLVQANHAGIRPAPQIAVAMSGRLTN